MIATSFFGLFVATTASAFRLSSMGTIDAFPPMTNGHVFDVVSVHVG